LLAEWLAVKVKKYVTAKEMERIKKNERKRKTRDRTDGCEASGLCATMHVTRRKRKTFELL